tara:strand:- start:456 stop:944 length:489 start_codon:yes stop_codon:yes gene_type:complete
MNDKDLFALIDSLTKGQGQMSKTPMGREALFMTDPNVGVGSPENIDIQELLRGMTDPNSAIRSQFSSALGRNKLQRDVGESKSIDDIINQSDMVEFLSKAMADKTNVDSSEMPMGADITKYSSDDPLDLLFKMQNNQRREPSNIEGLMKILEDLSKAKPRTS